MRIDTAVSSITLDTWPIVCSLPGAPPTDSGQLGEMLNSNCNAVVARVSPDELNEKTWLFRLVSDDAGCRIFIEKYVELSRASKRNRWKTVARYDIASTKWSTLSRPMLPPDDVSEEALEILHRRVDLAMNEMLERVKRLETRQPNSEISTAHAGQQLLVWRA